MQPDPTIRAFQPRSQHLGVVIACIVEENVDHPLLRVGRLQFFEELSVVAAEIRSPSTQVSLEVSRSKAPWMLSRLRPDVA